MVRGRKTRAATKVQNGPSNGNTQPMLKPEAKMVNTNLFLQEPVLKLEFDKAQATVMRNGTKTPVTIKTSFLTSEITTKFQTLPPTEYINKVLNVNGSHDDDQQQNGHLLNSDSNSSDSGVVIIHSNESDGADLLRSPLQVPEKRRKPTTPHRMILCPSPLKIVEREPCVVNRQNAEIIKPARSRNRVRVKLPLSSENGLNQDHDHDYDVKLPAPEVEPKKPAKLPVTDGGNKKITEFFTVRRSVRKTKKEVQAERMRTLEQAILEEKEEGLEVRKFANKGRGIVTTRPFKRGEFVIEYIGDLISMSEAQVREGKYAADDNTGCYMYYFKHNEQQYCIDATKETGKLGRLVNHSRNGNLTTKTVLLGKRPHLVLIAKDDLEEGVEVTYDYGDRSKEAIQHHPWLAF